MKFNEESVQIMQQGFAYIESDVLLEAKGQLDALIAIQETQQRVDAVEAIKRVLDL